MTRAILPAGILASYAAAQPPNLIRMIRNGSIRPYAGTYLFLSPLSSLRLFDDGRPFTPVYAEGAQATAKKIAADTEIIRKHIWLRVDPRLSYESVTEPK